MCSNLFERDVGTRSVRRAPLDPVGGKAWAVLALVGHTVLVTGRCAAALAVLAELWLRLRAVAASAKGSPETQITVLER